MFFVVDHLLLLLAAFPLFLTADLFGRLLFFCFDLKEGLFDLFDELFSGVVPVECLGAPFLAFDFEACGDVFEINSGARFIDFLPP